MTDGEQRSELHTGDRRLRERYRAQRQQQWDVLRGDLLRLGVPLLRASTDQAPIDLLQPFYGDRRR